MGNEREFFMKMNYQITILRPAGNDTALVKGIVEKKLRKKINDTLLRKYPNVEQVGFYSFDEKNNLARLEMAGGEFCGNATRSLAYLLLRGKKGRLRMRVSGTKRLLKTGIKTKNTSFAQIPIEKSFTSIKQLDKNIYKVELKGITHLVVPFSKEKDLKTEGKKLLKQYNLLTTVPASGVMFIKEVKNEIKMEPIVWVRDIQTLFYETACASGTTAVGLWKATAEKKHRFTYSVGQPSKENLTVLIEKNNKSFVNATIYGPIKKLLEEEVNLNE